MTTRPHAEFHREAARVAELVATGNGEAGSPLLKTDFAAKSDILMRALVKWKGEVERWGPGGTTT